MKFRKGWLKEARKEAGAPQKDLVAGLGVARSTIDNYETGKPLFSEEQFERLRRTLLLPHLSWERGHGSYRLLEYGDRAGLASVGAGDFEILGHVEGSVMRSFSAARQNHKAHLFLVCFEDFLNRVQAFASPPGAAIPSKPVTLRDVLKKEYFDWLEGRIENLQREVLEIALKLEKNSPRTRPGKQGRMFTAGEREELKGELTKRQGSLEMLTNQVQSGKVSDRDLVGLYKKLRKQGKFGNFGNDLDLRMAPPAREDSAIDLYWRRLFQNFERIGSGPEDEWENVLKAFGKVGYEPDEVEWEHFVEDFDPKLVPEICPDGTIYVWVTVEESSFLSSDAEEIKPGLGVSLLRLLYVNGASLPLELDSFGKVSLKEDGYVCVVKFRESEPFRYLQLLACTADDQWHKSCLYAINREGRIIKSSDLPGEFVAENIEKRFAELEANQ